MPKKNRLTLLFEGQTHEITGTTWRRASASDLVEAAVGRFLPDGVIPYRLVRNGATAGFYDPTLPHSIGQAGDILEVIVDEGQAIELASFAGYLRRLREQRLDTLALLHAMGLAQSHRPAA